MRGPQRADRHRHLAVRHQRARRRARHRQRRLPRARAGPRQPAHHRRHARRPRAARGRPGARRARPHRRRVGRGRAPSASCCAPGRSARRRSCCARAIGPDGSVARLPVGEGAQEHPLALFWLFAPARTRRRRARPAPDQLPACATRPGWPDAGENDMMIVSVNQTLALPPEVDVAPGGRGTRRPGRGVAPAAARPPAVRGCCASGSTSSTAAAGCGSPPRTRTPTR